MTTFLSGGTGTPKLLTGVTETTDCVVVGNTGDDVELGGHLICPDLDTVIFLLGGVLDRETWWGIADDTVTTHDRILEISSAMGFDSTPRRLSDEAQVSGREIARWRRFSGVGEFMKIGDYDRAIHIVRTSLIDEGYSLTEITRELAGAFEVPVSLYPMSNDPVATIIHTPSGELHFQEYWVAHRASPKVEAVEYRGTADAAITPSVREALTDEVIIGPSNPRTSI
jgi:LPPG:FO 2-phospho-L-lactate transferase